MRGRDGWKRPFLPLPFFEHSFGNSREGLMGAAGIRSTFKDYTCSRVRSPREHCLTGPSSLILFRSTMNSKHAPSLSSRRERRDTSNHFAPPHPRCTAKSRLKTDVGGGNERERAHASRSPRTPAIVDASLEFEHCVLLNHQQNCVSSALYYVPVTETRVK